MKLTKTLLTSVLLGASILSFHSTVAAMDFGTQVGIDAYRKKDFAQAAEQFKDAGIVRGDAKAQLFLGRMYYEGEFFKQDYVEAAKWYRKAAEQGEEYGLLFLGEMYENGEGVEKDYAEAIKLYSKAAEQGDFMALFFLGDMYANGLGVKQNKVKAKELFKKSCKQGSEEACEALKSYNKK
ncbi:TPA: tetratricopeptide repeat protein [Haemophilus influenzae]